MIALLTSDVIRTRAVSAGAFEAVVAVMLGRTESKDAQISACGALSSLTSSVGYVRMRGLYSPEHDIATRAVNAGTVQALMTVTRRHAGYEDIQESSFHALCNITERCVEETLAIFMTVPVDDGSSEALRATLRRSVSHVDISLQAVSPLHNITTSSGAETRSCR